MGTSNARDFNPRTAHRLQNPTFLEADDITGIQLGIQEEVRSAISDMKIHLSDFLQQQNETLKDEIHLNDEETRNFVNSSIQSNNQGILDYLTKHSKDMMDHLTTTLQNQFQAAVSQAIENSVKKEVQNMRDELMEVLTDKSISPRHNPHYSNTPDRTLHNPLPSIFSNPPPQNSNFSPPTFKQANIKLPTYDGTTPWSQYERLLDVIANENGWSNKVTASYLLLSLRGKSQTIIETLPVSDLTDINKLKSVLNSRFGEQQFYRVYHSQLRARVQQKNEDLKTFAEDVEKLTRLAYYNASESVKDQIGCEQFINGLNNSQIETTLRLEHFECLTSALQRALEIHAIHNIIGNKKQNQNSNYHQNNDQFGNNPNRPRNNYNNQSNPTNRRHIICSFCGYSGHYANECRKAHNPNSNPNLNKNDHQNPPTHNSNQNRNFYQRPNTNTNYENRNNQNQYLRNNQSQYSRNNQNQYPRTNLRTQIGNQQPNQRTNCFFTQDCSETDNPSTSRIFTTPSNEQNIQLPVQMDPSQLN